MHTEFILVLTFYSGKNGEVMNRNAQPLSYDKMTEVGPRYNVALLFILKDGKRVHIFKIQKSMKNEMWTLLL